MPQNVNPFRYDLLFHDNRIIGIIHISLRNTLLTMLSDMDKAQWEVSSVRCLENKSTFDDKTNFPWPLYEAIIGGLRTKRRSLKGIEAYDPLGRGR